MVTSSSLLVSVQLDAFLSGLDPRKYSKHTRSAYAADLNRFVDFLTRSLGRAPSLPDLNPEHVKRYYEAEQMAGKNASTLLRRRASLRRFARYLARKGHDFEDFTSGIALPEYAPTPNSMLATEPLSLTADEQELLTQTMEKSASPRSRRDAAILHLLLESGLSIADLLSLNVVDLDLERAQLKQLDDEGLESWAAIPRSITSLRKYLQEGRPDLAHSGKEKALFLSQMGKRMKRQSVWQAFSNWGRRAGLLRPLTPRLLRNTAAAQMAAAGRTVSEIQLALRHRNPLSTRALLRRLAADGKS